MPGPSYVTNVLTSLPFGNIIGGPMKAAIEAQALAAKATVDFIQTVGFTAPTSGVSLDASGDWGVLRTLQFEYAQHNVDGTEQTATLTVPVLTVVPIPHLRIDEMTIDFMVKITEEYKNSHDGTTEAKFDTSASGGFKPWWGGVNANFNASLSVKHSSTSSSSSRFQTEATMNVHVRAVQDSIPGGLQRMLTILENAIVGSHPVNS